MGEKKLPKAPLAPWPDASGATGRSKVPFRVHPPKMWTQFVQPQKTPSQSRSHGSGLKFEELFGDLGDLNEPSEMGLPVEFSIPPPVPNEAMEENGISALQPPLKEAVPPPPPKDALDSMADDELTSMWGELNEMVQEINQSSTGKGIEEVIQVGEKFATPDEVRADAKRRGIKEEDYFEEMGILEKKAALERAADVLKKEEEDRKSKKAIMDGITELLVEGEGAQVEDLSVFDEVGPENQWGLRRVKWCGRFNFIDRENRILCPRKKDEWFDEVAEFKLKGVGNGFVSTAAVALARCGKDNFFLGVDGELVPASLQEIQSFVLGQGVERPGMRWEQGVATYWDSFWQKFESARKRYSNDPVAKESYGQLGSALAALKGICLPKGWAPMLISIKGAIEASSLSGGHKAHLYWMLRSLAVDAKVDSTLVATQFPIPEMEKGASVTASGQYDNGLILRIEHQGKVRYNLMDVEGKWLYSPESAFEAMGSSFTDQIVMVRRGGKVNFLNHKDGALVSEAWFTEVGEPHSGLYRVNLGKTFNYMTSKGQWLSAMPFDEADDFNSRGRARVRSGKEVYYINAKGERIMSFDTMRIFQDIFRIRSERRMPKDEMKKNILEVIPEAKEYKHQPHLGEELHGLFEALLAEYPEKADGLMALFGQSRKILNIMIEKGKSQKLNHALCGHKAYGEIEEAMIASDIPSAAKARLRQFSLKIAALPWRKIEPLPIPFLASFSALLRQNPEEEVRLISLLREMENLTNLYALWSKDNLRKLLPDFEFLLGRSGLQPSTQRQVRQVFLSKMGNQDSYWRRGSSVDAWKPVSKAAIRLQESIPPPVRKPVYSEIGNPIPKLHFARLCEEFSQGDLASVGKKLESFDKLSQDNLGYAFDYGKMGLALFAAIQRLQKTEPEAPSRLVGPTIQALQNAVEGGDQKAQVHFVLGQLREFKARSNESFLSRLSIGKNHVELNQAVDSYEKAMGSSPNEKLRSQIEMRHGEAKGVLRRRTRVRWVLLLALGLASAGAATYHFRENIQSSDFIDQLKRELMQKPVEPVIERPKKDQKDQKDEKKTTGVPPVKKTTSGKSDSIKRKEQLEKAFSEGAKNRADEKSEEVDQ